MGKPVSIMRAMGLVAGDLAAVVTGKPRKKIVVRETRTEEARDGVVLRRTVIEEIEVRPDAAPPPPRE